MRATWVVALVLAVGLMGVVRAADPPAPPEGWKEYNPQDKVFTVWVPTGGKRIERADTVTLKVRAKAGYAVAAINGREGGIRVAGFTVTFMKVAGAALDPKDRYDSEWIGGKTVKADKTQGGDGRPVIGIHGAENGGTLSGLGLLLPPADKEPAPKK